MMKIVWSIICLQYFGSINKMNLNKFEAPTIHRAVVLTSQRVNGYIF